MASVDERVQRRRKRSERSDRLFGLENTVRHTVFYLMDLLLGDELSGGKPDEATELDVVLVVVVRKLLLEDDRSGHPEEGALVLARHVLRLGEGILRRPFKRRRHEAVSSAEVGADFVKVLLRDLPRKRISRPVAL
jgi:hypothetical protein